MKKIFVMIVVILIQGCALMDDQKNIQPYEAPQNKYVANPIAYKTNSAIPDENSLVIENPFKADKETIDAGKVLYRQFCYHCHGVNYDGNAPVGESLMKKPADLKGALVQLQSDKELFMVLSNGKGLSPALKNSMSAKERWQVITFIRTIK